ncbi:hypothetical protein [Sulfitobacter sp.]|uniref:hypothetical protein n=1 Tax=Sulfitobacter sp. TaxID=1903071 RepID=UPI003EFA7FF4
MEIFLPEGFEPGLTRPPMSRPVRAAQLTVEAGGVYYPVLRHWATGFAVRAGDVPALNGVVEMYDGPQHLGQCLITGKDQANGEIVFRVKRGFSVDYAAVPELEAEGLRA